MPPKVPKTAITPSGKIRMVEAGEVILVDTPEEAAAARERGADFESPTEAVEASQRADLQRRYGGFGEGARAGAEGALDTFIPGAGTLFSEGVGSLFGEAPGGTLARAQVHPGARTAGTLAGVGLGLISGQAGAGVGALTGLSGLAARGANAITRGGGVAKAGVLGRGVAAGALETGLFSAGQAVSSAVITDKPLTGEALAANILKEAALGTVLGGALGGAGAALTLGGRAIKARGTKQIFSASDNTSVNAREAARLHFNNLDEYSKFAKGAGDDVAGFTGGLQGLAAGDLRRAKADFAKSLGSKTVTADDFIRVLESGSDDAAIRAAGAYDKYVKAIDESLGAGGEASAATRGVLAQQGEAFDAAIKTRIDDLLGKEGAFEAGGGLKDLVAIAGLEVAEPALGDLGPVASTVLQGVLLSRVVKGAVSKKGSGLLGQASQSFIGRATEGGLRRTAGTKLGLGQDLALGIGAVGNLAARKATAKVLDKDIGSAVRAQLGSQGRIGRAVTRFGKQFLRGPVQLAAHKSFDGVLTGAEKDDIASKKNDAQKFKAQMKAVNGLVNNPDALAQRMREATSAISVIDPELGELTKNSLLTKTQYLAEKFPINPGNMTTIAGDRWVPSPQDLIKFGRYAEAVHDPAGIVERAMAGRLTPEAAEVLKELEPAHFAEMQKRIMEDPNIIEKMENDYHMRVNLGLLFDVPTDPTLMIMPQLQDNFRILDEQAQAAVQAGPTPEAPSTGLNQPTAAQKLENR